MMPVEKDDLKTLDFKVSAGARLVCGLFIYYLLGDTVGQNTTKVLSYWYHIKVS